MSSYAGFTQPPPYQDRLLTESGRLSPTWVNWFQNFYDTVKSLDTQSYDFTGLEVAPTSGATVTETQDSLEPPTAAVTIEQLHDVGAFDPSDGDKLIFNGDTNKWEKDSRSYLILDE